MFDVESNEKFGPSGEKKVEEKNFGNVSGKETVDVSSSDKCSEDSKEDDSHGNNRYVHVDHNVLSTILNGADDTNVNEAATFYCQICFENNDESVAFQLPCRHKFCKECITSYVHSKVLDGKVYPVCFFIDEDKETPAEVEETASTRRAHLKHTSCGAEIPQYVLENLLRPDTTMLEKYRRYKFAKENTNARECPFCEVWNIVSPEDLARPNGSKITCMNSECQKVYCFYHANAHDFDVYPTCAEYDTAMAPQLKANEDYVNSCSKPCPGCHIYVSKSGGCNHMKCQCGVCFCWLCGKQIDDSIFPAHFQWWNPSGCSNLQMNEANQPSTCSRINAALLSCLQIIVLGPLTLASTLTSSLLCCSCIMLKLQMQRPLTAAYVRTFFSTCITSWGAFWMFVLLVPLVIAGGSAAAALVLVCMILIYPCYAIQRMRENEYPWPDWITATFRSMLSCFQSCCDCSTSYTYANNNNNNNTADSNALATDGNGSMKEDGIVSSNSSDEMEQPAVDVSLQDVEQGRLSAEYEDFSPKNTANRDETSPVSKSQKGNYCSVVTAEPCNPSMDAIRARSMHTDIGSEDNIDVSCNNSVVVLGDIDIESPRVV